MGIHYDYKSTKSAKLMEKQAKREKKLAEKKAKRLAKESPKKDDDHDKTLDDRLKSAFRAGIILAVEGVIAVF